MCRHIEARYFHRVLSSFFKRIFIYLFLESVFGQILYFENLLTMKDIKQSTKDLNFIKSITLYALSQEEMEHCLQLCNIPKTSFNHLRKYGIIEKIGQDIFIFQR